MGLFRWMFGRKHSEAVADFAAEPEQEAVMPKKPKAVAWTEAEIKNLQKLAKQNTPTRLMAWKLGRTESSIRNKARAIGLSLKPVNQPSRKR